MIIAVFFVLLVTIPSICIGFPLWVRSLITDAPPFKLEISNLTTVRELAVQLLRDGNAEVTGLPEVYQKTADYSAKGLITADAISIYFRGRELDRVQLLFNVLKTVNTTRPTVSFKTKQFAITGEVFKTNASASLVNFTRRDGKSYQLRVAKLMDIDYGQFAIGQTGMMRQIEKMTRVELRKAGRCHDGPLDFLMDVAIRNVHLVSDDDLHRAMTYENVFHLFDTQFVESKVMHINAAYREKRLLAPPLRDGQRIQHYFVRINMDKEVGIMLI